MDFVPLGSPSRPGSVFARRPACHCAFSLRKIDLFQRLSRERFCLPVDSSLHSEQILTSGAIRAQSTQGFRGPCDHGPFRLFRRLCSSPTATASRTTLSADAKARESQDPAQGHFYL